MHLIRRMSVLLAATIMVTAVVAMPTAAAASPLSRVDTGQLIALGSLGGGESWAGKLNERGDIVGGSTDARNDWQGAVWWSGRRSASALGIDNAFPGLISDNGHIVGRLGDGSGLFLWRRGTVTYVRQPAGMDLTEVAVNDFDQIVGTAYYRSGTSRAFLWQRGRLTLLPVPRAMNSAAVDINNRGQIVGVVTPRQATTGIAVLWHGSQMIRLGTLGGTGSAPVAINDLGQVIGNSAIRGSAVEHPFLWQGDRMTDLVAGTTAIGGRVGALSDTGMAVGYVDWGDGLGHRLGCQRSR
jgi:probable HAF family extracellular repeat protein